MSGPTRLELVHKAIASNNIEWKDSALRLVQGDQDVKGRFPPIRIRKLLQGYVANGQELVERRETWEERRESDPDEEYWYKANIPVKEFPDGLFVKVILFDDDPSEPFVKIVSVHK